MIGTQSLHAKLRLKHLTHSQAQSRPYPDTFIRARTQILNPLNTKSPARIVYRSGAILMTVSLTITHSDEESATVEVLPRQRCWF